MLNGDNNLRNFGRCRLDVENKFLWHDDKPVDLPLKALELLCLLAGNDGAVVSKSTIWESVWQDAFVEETNLTHHIYLLRRKFKELNEPDPIQTVPRRGYRFNPQSNGDGLVIERHAVTQTLIEIEDSSRSFRFNRVAAVALVLIGLAGAAGFIAYQNRQVQSAPADVRSIAVLPLKSLGAGDSDGSLVLGLADALITALGKSPNIIVRPLTAVTDYVDEEYDALKVGQHLEVGAVLDGSFQRDENRLRVTVRLLRIPDGRQIWSGTFEDGESDIFRLQDRISTEAARALSLNLNQSDRDQILQRYTQNAAAYQAYQRGRYFYFLRVPKADKLGKALAEFKAAIELDPNYALAFTGLSDVYWQQALAAGDVETRRALYEKAEDAAKTAIALDPELAEAYASLGWIKRNYDWDWPAAEANLKRSIELAPNVWNHYRRYSSLLITLGRTAEAVEINRRAKELNPLQNDASVYYYNRQYEDAVAESLPQLRLSGDDDARHNLAAAYTELGRPHEAIDLLEHSEPLIRDGFKTRVYLAIAHFRSGNGKKAEILLREMEAEAGGNVENLTRLAYVYAAMSRTEQALTALKAGLEARDDRMLYIIAHPNFDGLRSDRRFQEILRKMNLM